VAEEPALELSAAGRQVRCHFPLSLERPAPQAAQEAN